VPVIKTRSPDQMYAIGGKTVTIALENFGNANIVTANAAVSAKVDEFVPGIQLVNLRIAPTRPGHRAR